jgi:hypothetical protein
MSQPWYRKGMKSQETMIFKVRPPLVKILPPKRKHHFPKGQTSIPNSHSTALIHGTAAQSFANVNNKMLWSLEGPGRPGLLGDIAIIGPEMAGVEWRGA